MSLSKGKCWYSNNHLHFLKCAVPLKIINNCLNINIIFYLEASGGQISYSCLTAVPFTNTHRYLTEIDFLRHICWQKNASTK